MGYRIEQLLESVFQTCGTLDREEWIGVMVVVTVLGYFCMRGFGSRTKY
ncbi:MAG: hypothetical protein ACQESR_24305 [Planctomycetota bacterium]